MARLNTNEAGFGPGCLGSNHHLLSRNAAPWLIGYRVTVVYLTKRLGPRLSGALYKSKAVLPVRTFPRKHIIHILAQSCQGDSRSRNIIFTMRQKATQSQPAMMRIAIAGGGGLAYILAQQLTQSANAILIISRQVGPIPS